MSNLKRIIPASLAILTTLVVVACGATSPTATPTLENTPLPATTPTLELQQMPKLPPPTMEGAIDVAGGHKLRYQCLGAGTPTVIVEAGADDRPTLSMCWNAVIQGVYPTTRICIYDRVPVRTSLDGAENLHALLSKIPVPGPYILVAHSIGGYYARVFAHLYLEEVAGMILVDTTPTYPGAWIIYATAYPTSSPDEPTSLTENRISEANIYTKIPPSVDGLDMKTSNEQVRQAGSLGDIPLVVISHTPGPDDWRGLDPVAQEQFAAILLKVQADLATLSSRGIFMKATTTKHFISEYEPQIIIDTIIQMLEGIRKH